MINQVCLPPFEGYYIPVSAKNKETACPQVEEFSSEVFEDFLPLKEEKQLYFEGPLPQTQVERLNVALSKTITLENNLFKGLDLQLNLVDFWKILASKFKNEPFLIGSFVGHLYDQEQVYNDVDYVNPITHVIIVNSLDKGEIREKIFDSVKRLGDGVRDTIEDILIDLYQQTYPTYKTPSRHEIWKMFFSQSVLINEPVDINLESYGNRFSLLRLGILEIKTVFELIIIPLGSAKEPLKIDGIEKPCAFSKDGLKITLKGLLEEGRATSSNTKVISVAGPVREAIKCLRVRELTTIDPDGTKFVKWLDYVTLRKYICSEELALEIFANCLNKFTAEMLLGKLERYFKQQKETPPLGILCCLLNMATLCEALIKAAPSAEVHAKAVLLKEALNEFAQGYLSKRSQSYLKQHPELKTTYLDFCKLLLLVVPTVALSKSEIKQTFRELISYEEQTYSLITLGNTFQLFTQFLHDWKDSSHSLIDLYRGVLLQARLKGERVITDSETCFASFVDAMQQFLLQRKEAKKLVLINHYITFFAPTLRQVGTGASIKWIEEDFELFLNTLGISSLDLLEKEAIENLFLKLVGCNDGITDYFALILYSYMKSSSYEKEKLKCLPRALSISHDGKLGDKLSLDPSLSLEAACIAILTQCSNEIKYELWAHYLDNNFFDTMQCALQVGYEISQMRIYTLQVWNKISVKSEFNSCPSERSLIFIEYLKASMNESIQACAAQVLEQPHFLIEASENLENQFVIFQFINELLEKVNTTDDLQVIHGLFQLTSKLCKYNHLFNYAHYFSSVLRITDDKQVISQLLESVFEIAVTDIEFIKHHPNFILDYLILVENNIEVLQKALTNIFQSGFTSNYYSEILDDIYNFLDRLFIVQKNTNALKKSSAFFEVCLKWLPVNDRTINLFEILSLKLLDTNDENLIRLTHTFLNHYNEDLISVTLNLKLVQKLIFKFDAFRVLQSRDSVSKAYDFFCKALTKLSQVCKRYESSELQLLEKDIKPLLEELVSQWKSLPKKALSVENAILLSELIESFDRNHRLAFIISSSQNTQKEMFPFLLNKILEYVRYGFSTSMSDFVEMYLSILKNPKISSEDILSAFQNLMTLKFLMDDELANIYVATRKRLGDKDSALNQTCTALFINHPCYQSAIKVFIKSYPSEFIALCKSIPNDSSRLHDNFSIMFSLTLEFFISKNNATHVSHCLPMLKYLFTQLVSLKEKRVSPRSLLEFVWALDCLVERKAHRESIGEYFQTFTNYLTDVIALTFSDQKFVETTDGCAGLEAVADALTIALSTPRYDFLDYKLIIQLNAFLGFTCSLIPTTFPKIFSGLSKKIENSFLCNRFVAFLATIEMMGVKKFYLPPEHIQEILKGLTVSVRKELHQSPQLGLLYPMVKSLNSLFVSFQYNSCFEDYVEFLRVSLRSSCSITTEAIVLGLIEMAQLACQKKETVKIVYSLIKLLYEVNPSGYEVLENVKERLIITIKSSEVCVEALEDVAKFRRVIEGLMTTLMNNLFIKYDKEEMTKSHEFVKELIEYGKLPFPFNRCLPLFKDLEEKILYMNDFCSVRPKKMDVQEKLFLFEMCTFMNNLLKQCSLPVRGDISPKQQCYYQFERLTIILNNWVTLAYPSLPLINTKNPLIESRIALELKMSPSLPS